MARFAGGAAGLFGPAARRALWWRWRHRYAFAWTDTVDERLDALWARASAASQGRVLGERSAAFLRWRLLAHPDEAHALGLLVERRSGELRGYVAVRRSGERVEVGDFYAEDGSYGPLLDAMLADLSHDGVEGVDVGYLGRPEVVAALRARGFRPREDLRTVIVDPGSVPAWLWEPSRQHLTSADGDL